METTIFTEKFVPDVYKDSRDFRVFLKLLDMVVSLTKYDIDTWIRLYDAYECPKDFLPALGDFVGYDYTNNFTVAESRVIIANMVELLQNRGSKIGLKEAVATLIHAKLYEDPYNVEYQQALNQLQTLEIFYDFSTGHITIYTSRKVDYDSEFFNYIRPVGSYLDFKVAEFPESESDMGISTDIKFIEHQNFIPKVEVDSQTGKVTKEDSTYRVEKAQVNLSQVGIFDAYDDELSKD